MLLSAALIVRDEADKILRCLRSLRGLADEIVVVDTGSTDATAAIARDAGARVFHVPWADDFARARNAALARCRGEFILYIDADEWVVRASARGLRRQLRRPGHAGFRVRLRARPGQSPYLELRIFRCDPTIRFEGIVHENIWPAIEAFRRAHPADAAIGESELLLEHDGYEGEPKRKRDRYLPLLRRELRRDPTRIYCWCHLASIHADEGEHALAERAFERALALARQGLPSATHLVLYMALITYRRARKRPYQRLLREARRRLPAAPQLLFLEAEALIERRRYSEALSLVDALLAAGPDSADPATAFDLRLFGEWAYAARAACAFGLAQYPEAAAGYRAATALAAPEAQLEYRVKAALADQLAKRMAFRRRR